MARPQKDGLDYFPHDVYASSDEKIEPLLLLYGAKGYSFYFIHLEYIYRNASLEFNISDAETREVICQKLKITAEEYTRILQTALKKLCFDKEYFDKTGKLTSSGIKKRASIVTEKREKMRKHYESKKKIVSDAETTEETQTETPQSKEKKSKENKSKSNINIVHVQSFFESVWKLYPNKKGKGQISDTQKAKLYGIGAEELKRCIERYTKTKPDWQQYQNGSTFFNSGYVDYLDKNFSDRNSEQVATDYCDLSNYTPEE